MAYATWVDVERRFDRDLTDREKTQVTEWLDDVEDSILTRIPDLAAQVAAGSVKLRTVVKVEASVVLRKLNNPQGKLTERIDDYSWTRDSSTATGALCLTDEDWEELTPSVSTDAFSIRLAYEPGCRQAPDAWWAP